MKRAAVPAVLLAALSAVPLAVPARAAPGEPASGEAAPVCPAPQAAEFTGDKGFRLWVTRQGSMTWSNPLRPLSPETVQVLQVVIRNKLATAYGPDLSGLRRGPSPAALEAQNGATIQWAGAPEGLPRTLRILADDGGQVLAELAFQACGDAPKAAEPKPAPTARKGGSKKVDKTRAAQGRLARGGGRTGGRGRPAAEAPSRHPGEPPSPGARTPRRPPGRPAA